MPPRCCRMCCLMQQFPEGQKFLCDRLRLRQVEADQHENPLSLLLAGTRDVVHTVPGSRAFQKDPVIVSPPSGLEVDVQLLRCNHVAYLFPRAYARSGFILLTWLVGGWRTNPKSTPRTIPYNPCTRPYTPFLQPQLRMFEGSHGLQLRP